MHKSITTAIVHNPKKNQETKMGFKITMSKQRTNTFWIIASFLKVPSYNHEMLNKGVTSNL
jgi:hypothetical protein